MSHAAVPWMKGPLHEPAAEAAAFPGATSQSAATNNLLKTLSVFLPTEINTGQLAVLFLERRIGDNDPADEARRRGPPEPSGPHAGPRARAAALKWIPPPEQ